MSAQMNDVLVNFMRHGGSLRMLAKMDPKDLALLYAYSVQLYEGGEYESAKSLLNLLIRLDHWNFSYWQALGQCYQQVAEYHQAIYCFSRAGQICVDNPLPACCAGECYSACGNQSYAKKAFLAALNWCHVHPEMTDICERAERGVRLTAEV